MKAKEYAKKKNKNEKQRTNDLPRLKWCFTRFHNVQRPCSAADAERTPTGNADWVYVQYVGCNE